MHRLPVSDAVELGEALLQPLPLGLPLPLPREGETVVEGEELLAGLAVLSKLQLSKPLSDGKMEGLSLALLLPLLLPLGEAGSRRRGALPRNRPPARTRALNPSSAWGRGASGSGAGNGAEPLTWGCGVSGCSALGSHPSSSATREKRKHQQCIRVEVRRT